jgi:hypothetical protein
MAEEQSAFMTIEDEGADADLSSKIAKAIPRKAREQVTCRRISKNHYRCNWWTPQDTAGYDNPEMTGMTVTTSRISQSQFLRVTREGGKEGGKLQIQVVPGGPSAQ